MDDKLACYGCGLIFDASDADWDMEEDDPSAACPDCDSHDIVSYETYLADIG